VRNAEDGRWRVVASPRRPDPRLLVRCRGGKPRRVPSGLTAGVDPPACPEGAREAKRGEPKIDGSRRAVRGGTPVVAETAPGASKPYRRYFSNLNLCKPAQPHEGRSGAGDGDPLARADPDSRRRELEP